MWLGLPSGLALLSCFAAATAWAGAPPLLPVQGVLTDSAGAPIGVPTAVRFSLHTLPVGGAELWHETQDVTPEAGFFTVYLGSTEALDLALFRDHAEIWIELAVGADEPMPRVRLGSAAFAGFADACGPHTHVSEDLPAGLVTGGQSCGATELARGFDAAGELLCTPDVFGALSCAPQQIPKWSGAGWVCAADELGAATGDITDVLAGDGLQGGGTTGPVLLQLARCAPGEILARGASSWQCTLNYRPATWVPSWSEVTGKPAGLVSGAQACAGSDKVRGVDATGSVLCAADVDTQSSEAAVDAMVANNGYALQSSLATVATTGSWNDLSNRPGNLLAGSGSDGYLSRFSAPAVLGASGLYQDGSGNFGIGTTGPQGILHLAQSSPCWNCGLTFSLGPNTWKVLADLDGSLFTIAPNNDLSKGLYNNDGDVGIGTHLPAAKLDVAGDAMLHGGMAIKAYVTDISALGQGLHLQWNRLVGDGASWILNQRGSGQGGFRFGEIDGSTVTTVLQIQSNITNPYAHQRTPNLIGGYWENSVTPGVYGAVIAGGGFRGIDLWENHVADRFGAIGGGSNNTAGNDDGDTGDDVGATVAGGESNRASAVHATVAGGSENSATGEHSTIAGGGGNTASGTFSMVGGGWANVASGAFGAVPGGYSNIAAGQYSLAAGLNAHANADGCFVWADYNASPVECSVPNQLIARATGGVTFFTTTALNVGVRLAAGAGSWSSLSDRAAKRDLVPVEPREVLARVAAMPVGTWRYESETSGARHMGPMAQDFHAAFGLGDSDKSITAIDADGVALAAIQGLYAENAELRAEVKALHDRLARIEGARAPSRADTAMMAVGIGGLVLAALSFGRRREAPHV